MDEYPWYYLLSQRKTVILCVTFQAFNTDTKWRTKNFENSENLNFNCETHK